MPPNSLAKIQRHIHPYSADALQNFWKVHGYPSSRTRRRSMLLRLQNHGAQSPYGVAVRSSFDAFCIRFIVFLLFQTSTLLMQTHQTTNSSPNAMLQPMLSVANHTKRLSAVFSPLLSVSHICLAPMMTCIALRATLNNAKMNSTTGKNRWKYAV
jgi:hypothetical protein